MNEKSRLMYSNVDEDTFDINGVKLNVKLGKVKNNKTVDMPNSEKYKFKNECMFGNVFEYHLGKDNKPHILMVEARLTEVMRSHFNFQQSYHCLEKMIRTMLNMVPDTGSEDYKDLLYQLCHDSNIY